MASWRTQPVLADVGSEELKKLRLSYNSLLDVVGDLLDALEAASDVAAVNAAATAALAAVEVDTAGAKKVGAEPNIPERPSRAVTS
jgi:hypothetical protein